MDEKIKKELKNLTYEELQTKMLEINSIPMNIPLTKYQESLLKEIRKLMFEMEEKNEDKK